MDIWEKEAFLVMEAGCKLPNNGPVKGVGLAFQEVDGFGKPVCSVLDSGMSLLTSATCRVCCRP